jgi:hypothetical protein
LGLGLLGLLLIGNAVSAYSMISTSKDQFVFVSKDIIELKKINNYENVTSINIQEPSVWTQMWIYYFFFDKHRLYLKYPSYYVATTLNGEWTLMDRNPDILSVSPSNNTLQINSKYYLEKNSSCNISLYKGWYDLESSQETIWRWSGMKNETPSVIIDCGNVSQHINVSLDYKPLNPENHLSISLDGERLALCPDTHCEISNVKISNGTHIFSFNATLPPQQPGNGDPRYLGYAFTNITLSKNV